MEPFRIICTTCQARLTVYKPEAIGQILACPRCESMVLVTPPPETTSAASVPDPWTSPVERLWRKTPLWSTACAAGLVLMGGVLGVWLTRDRGHPPQAPPVARAAPDDEVSSSEPAANEPPQEAPGDGVIDAEPAATIESEEPRPAAPVENAQVETVENEAQDATDEPPAEVLASHEEPALRPAVQTVGAEMPAGETEVRPPASTGVTVVQYNRSPTRVLSPADVAGRLGLKLRRVDFEAVSLADLVDFVSDLVHAPITLDMDGLEAAGVRPTATTSIHRQDSTVAGLLAAALGDHGLVYVVEDGHIIVTGKQPSRQRREHSRLEARTGGMSDALAKPVTFTFLQPTRLVRVASFLEQVGDVTIVIDWRSLAAVDFTFDTRISCAVDDRPLGEALTAVLAPLGLTWRAADGQTLQITRGLEPVN